MCGRYVSFSSTEQLVERFDIDAVTTGARRERYNVAPSQAVDAIVDADGERRLGELRWGFVPPWSKDPRKGPSPINARLETVASSRMFAPAFKRRRCLLPADAFYEWQDRGEGRRKQPYLLRRPDEEPMAFAGIFSSWRDRDAGDDAEPLFTCAIVTTSAQGEMASIHHRCPLILPERLWQPWLDTADTAGHLYETVAELGPPPLRATPITDRVNKVSNDGPELLEPGEVA